MASSGQPHILDLPNEMLEHIASFLPPAERLSFFLTCDELAPLRQRAMDRIGELTGDERIHFLLMLEKDDPRSCICFGCEKLAVYTKGRRRRWANKAHYSCGRQIIQVALCTKVFGFPRTLLSLQDFWLHTWSPCQEGADGPKITFTDAHLVMNRHRLGENHRLPIHILDESHIFQRQLPVYHALHGHIIDDIIYDHYPLGRHPTSRHGLRDLPAERHRPSQLGGPSTVRGNPLRRPDQGWLFHHQTKAKIVDNALLIRRFHHVIGPPRYRGLIEKVIDSLQLPVCYHIVLGRCDDLQLPFAHDGHQQGSCKVCLSAFAVKWRHTTIENRFEMILMTFHVLGPCRRPDKQPWIFMFADPLSLEYTPPGLAVPGSTFLALTMWYGGPSWRPFYDERSSLQQELLHAFGVRL